MGETKFKVQLPQDVDKVSPYNEYFILVQGEQKQEIRIHDYETVYKIPGLYEKVVSEMLKCVSPEVVAELFVDTVIQNQGTLDGLRVLDFGAGIGLVGDALARQGVDAIIGVDIIPAAKEAAARDHPDVYQSYYVQDICQPDPQVRTALKKEAPNCLVCVSALDAGHILPGAFTCAFELLPLGGWVALNFKEDLVEADDELGLTAFIEQIMEEEWLHVRAQRRYRHRILIDGTPLEYRAVVGQKRGEIAR